jgi:nucleotide-binding universal stress UspA family protein
VSSAWRTLLVPLGDGPTAAERTRHAMRLAATFDAHLCALVPAAWHGAAAAAQQMQRDCEAAGLHSFETVVDDGPDPAAGLVRYARSADLVLLSPPHAGFPAALVERVLLEGARPVLLVPASQRAAPAGDRVLVAWDDSRGAARAASDALPLLARAGRVELVGWRERGSASDADEAARHAGLEAAQRWLRRHAIVCRTYLETAHGRLADVIGARAAEIDAGLVVMGAYGHGRWAERMLGGATLGMLGSMTVPVLMSH